MANPEEELEKQIKDFKDYEKRRKKTDNLWKEAANGFNINNEFEKILTGANQAIDAQQKQAEEMVNNWLNYSNNIAPREKEQPKKISERATELVGKIFNNIIAGPKKLINNITQGVQNLYSELKSAVSNTLKSWFSKSPETPKSQALETTPKTFNTKQAQQQSNNIAKQKPGLQDLASLQNIYKASLDKYAQIAKINQQRIDNLKKAAETMAPEKLTTIVEKLNIMTEKKIESKRNDLTLVLNQYGKLGSQHYKRAEEYKKLIPKLKPEAINPLIDKAKKLVDLGIQKQKIGRLQINRSSSHGQGNISPITPNNKNQGKGFGGRS